MKKSAITFAVSMMVSGSFAQAAELQSIRILQTATQFSEAVAAEQVYVDFSSRIPLKRVTPGAASTEIVKTMKTKNPDNSDRTLTMACKLTLLTKARKPQIASTIGSSHKWQVTDFVSKATEDVWFLHKSGSPGMMVACRASELSGPGGEVRPISMTASMIDRVLSEKGGRVKTLIQPDDVHFANAPLNQGLAQPTLSVDSPSVQTVQ